MPCCASMSPSVRVEVRVIELRYSWNVPYFYAHYFFVPYVFPPSIHAIFVFAIGKT